MSDASLSAVVQITAIAKVEQKVATGAGMRAVYDVGRS